MDDELDPVTRAAIQRLRFLLDDAERELNDATVKTKVLRHALFEVEGTAHQEADKARKKAGPNVADDKGECAECGGFFGPGAWADVWCESCQKAHRSCPHCEVPLEFPSIAAVLAMAREEHEADRD